MKRKKIDTFKRHFRIYFKNNHPAYIVDEEGNLYVFHRVTHSKTSGGKLNWEKKLNPLKGSNKPMRIVKKQEKDAKARFSMFELELKDGVDISYPDIKIVGVTQTKQDYNNQGRAWVPSDTGSHHTSKYQYKSININKTKKKKKNKV